MLFSKFDSRATFCLQALICLSLVVGCADKGPKRYRLEGTVEFDGKPVPFGTITFDPDASKGNKGPQGFAQIVDGKFDTEKEGKGHVGGPMIVRITGMASAEKAVSDDKPVPQLFPDFTESVELEKSDDMRGFIIPKDYGGPPAAKPVVTSPGVVGP